MGAIFGGNTQTPPPPPPPPPAANPPVYASAAVQGTANANRRKASGVPGFGDTVKTDAMGGPKASTAQKELMGAG